MDLRPDVQLSFLALLAGQSIHSIEETATGLWEVWGPAAAISSLISNNQAAGFAIANSVIVLFGFWCYAFPIRNSAASAPVFLWFWTVLEFGNGIGHLIMGINAAGYFPGLITAPWLLAASLYLGSRLLKQRGVAEF